MDLNLKGTSCETQEFLVFPVRMNEVCMNVDGQPQLVNPVAFFQAGQLVKTIYLNAFGAEITGAVTPADFCDCNCENCED